MYDVEDGHVQIANDLLEDICKLPLSGAGFRVLFWAIRNSYGFNRKHTRPASIKNISKAVDISSTGTIHNSVCALLDSGILSRNKKNQYEIHKEKVFSVLKTERPFRKLNVQKTERPVQKTECPVQKTERSECNIKKDNLKDNLKDMGSTRAPFCPPSLAEITDYCQTRKNSVNPDLFLAHYESNGWRVGRNPMRNWQAAVRYWEKNGINAPAKAKTAKGCAPVPGKYDGLGEKV